MSLWHLPIATRDACFFQATISAMSFARKPLRHRMESFCSYYRVKAHGSHCGVLAQGSEIIAEQQIQQLQSQMTVVPGLADLCGSGCVASKDDMDCLAVVQHCVFSSLISYGTKNVRGLYNVLH